MSAAVACAPAATREAMSESHGSLNAASSTLWSVENGVATISVCWLPPQLAPDRFPVVMFGPSAGFIEERKAWVREIAEQQWNALTPLKFVGWNDCDERSTNDVQLLPIDSLAVPSCGAAGQACVEAFGTLLRGKIAYLNLFFGDEFLYSSRYGQSSTTETYQPSLDLATRADGSMFWLPGACLDELRQTWTTGSDPAFRRDIFDATTLGTAVGIIKGCLQNNVLHELGHAAGFAHEQYRSDDPASRDACVEIVHARGTTDDIANVPLENRGDRPLGTFDLESIMSYCRTDKAPTLTAEDIGMTRLAYAGSTN
jgi:hypothetical protein